MLIRSSKWIIMLYLKKPFFVHIVFTALLHHIHRESFCK